MLSAVKEINKGPRENKDGGGISFRDMGNSLWGGEIWGLQDKKETSHEKRIGEEYSRQRKQHMQNSTVAQKLGVS